MKFWLEPTVSVARNYGLRGSQVSEIQRTVEEHKDEIAAAWRKHFGR